MDFSSSNGTPISAGIFIIRARIAVWEFVEPCTVTKARILLLSICTVSLGVRSSATMIDGSMVLQSICSSPDRLRTSRLEISLTSAERACIYSSSMLANISANYHRSLPPHTLHSLLRSESCCEWHPDNRHPRASSDAPRNSCIDFSDLLQSLLV